MVNKERARSGESQTAGKTSIRGKRSASPRGAERSHGDAHGPTRDRLYEEAKKENIESGSSMNEDQLRKAAGHSLPAAVVRGRNRGASWQFGNCEG